MMLKLIRNRAGLVLAGLIAALCPMLMAPTGGFPSQPTFQSVTVNNTTGAQNFGQMVLNTTTSGIAAYMAFSNLSSIKGVITNERTAGSNCSGSLVDDFCLRSISGRLYGVDSTGAGEIPVLQDSGALTWSFQTANSNCSVNGTDATITLHKIGKLVTGIRTGGSGTCTSAATGSLVTTNAPVPATFRPGQAVSCGATIVNAAVGYVCVANTGQFSLNIPSGTATTWTLSGVTFTYTVD